MKARLCTLLFCLVILPQLHPQTPKVTDIPPPKDPVLAAMPTDSAWTLEAKQEITPAFKPQSAEQEAALQMIRQLNPRINRIEVTKSANWWHQIRTTDDGRALASWAASRLLFYQLPNDPNGTIAVASSLEVMAALRVGASDFPELAWVNTSNYVESALFEGKACWHFRDANHAPPGEEIPAYAKVRSDVEPGGANGQGPSVGREAWIDVKTRLPVVSRDGDLQYFYRYDGRKADSSGPPAEFLQVIRTYFK